MRLALVLAMLLLSGCMGGQPHAGDSEDGSGTNFPAADATQSARPSPMEPFGPPFVVPTAGERAPATRNPHTTAAAQEGGFQPEIQTHVAGLPVTKFGRAPEVYPESAPCIEQEPAITHRARYMYSEFPTNQSILAELEQFLGPQDWQVGEHRRSAKAQNLTIYWERLESAFASFTIRFEGAHQFPAAWQNATAMRSKYADGPGAWQNETYPGARGHEDLYYRWIDTRGGPGTGQWTVQVYSHEGNWNVWIRPVAALSGAPELPLRNETQWRETAARVLSCLGMRTAELSARWAREEAGSRAYIRVQHNTSFWGSVVMVDPWEDTVLMVTTSM